MAARKRNTEPEDTPLTSGQQKLITNGSKSTRPAFLVVAWSADSEKSRGWAHHTREAAEAMMKWLEEIAPAGSIVDMIEVPEAEGAFEIERRAGTAKPAPAPAPPPVKTETPPQPDEIVPDYADENLEHGRWV